MSNAMESFLHQFTFAKAATGPAPTQKSVMDAGATPPRDTNASEVSASESETASSTSSRAPATAASSSASGAAETIYACVECKKEFSSLRGVTTHIRQVHELKKYGNEWAPNR